MGADISASLAAESNPCQKGTPTGAICLATNFPIFFSLDDLTISSMCRALAAAAPPPGRAGEIKGLFSMELFLDWNLSKFFFQKCVFYLDLESAAKAVIFS